VRLGNLDTGWWETVIPPFSIWALRNEKSRTYCTLTSEVDRWVRRSYHQVAIVLGALALFATVMTVFLLVQDDPLALFYVLIPALLAAFLSFQAWIYERNCGRMQDFGQILNPASREVDYVHWRGVRTIFDNGLVLQTYSPGNGPNGLVFQVFLGADGAVRTPDSEDLKSWSGASPLITARDLRARSRDSPAECRVSTLCSSPRPSSRRIFRTLRTSPSRALRTCPAGRRRDGAHL